eukprot:Lithocolla_globosa_v1_NODE_186_length_5337_cov_5.779712.p6 type:complete len:106 gc:universal NODE_186_length_5337_cov_5.779712:4752-4435(-)
MKLEVICRRWCISSSVSLRRTMSSAKRKQGMISPSRLSPHGLVPNLASFNSPIRSLIHTMNNNGLKMLPCRVPVTIGKIGVCWPSTRTDALRFKYHWTSSSHALP